MSMRELLSSIQLMEGMICFASDGKRISAK